MSKPEATWYAQLTEGVTYWRCTLPSRHLPGKVLHSLEGLAAHRDGQGGWRFYKHRGTAIFSFPGSWAKAVHMRELQLQGNPVLVEVDDTYRTGPPLDLSEWKDTVEEAGGGYSYEAHEKIVPWTDGMIVSTPRLAQEYADLHDRIFVCPNSVDPDDWEQDPSHQARIGLTRDNVIYGPARSQARIRVGWAASDSHHVDAPLVDRALEWASRQPNVEVVIMGIQTWAFKFPHTFIPFSPMDDYRRNLQAIDIMVCPVKPSRWADCKSDVKALEAAMGGACPIVSDTEPFRPWQHKDSPALVARDAGEFGKHVRYLVHHPDEARDRAAKAREYVLNERTIQGNIWRWREAVHETAVDKQMVAA